MRIYSNDKRGQNTLDRMKITISMPGNEKFGIISRFEKPTVYNALYPYDYEFCEALIDFGALRKLHEAVVASAGKFVISSEEK